MFVEEASGCPGAFTFDLWAERWRHREAHGNVIYVRYADDIVGGFEHEGDAVRFLAELRERRKPSDNRGLPLLT